MYFILSREKNCTEALKVSTDLYISKRLKYLMQTKAPFCQGNSSVSKPLRLKKYVYRESS